jgi:3-methyladenine DNA glycosylase AlkD
MALPARNLPQENWREENDAARSVSVRPIDLVHLANQCLGDENLEREVLGLFDTTIATYLTRLMASETADDLGFNLHAIRSAATGIGAWGIVDQAAAAQVLLDANHPLTTESLSDIAHAVEEVRGYIAGALAD